MERREHSLVKLWFLPMKMIINNGKIGMMAEFYGKILVGDSPAIMQCMIFSVTSI